MKTPTQKERILADLLAGTHVNMLNDLERYGTSCRSRISELRADGYEIEDYTPKGESYKVYYMPKSFLEEYHSKRVA